MHKTEAFIHLNDFKIKIYGRGVFEKATKQFPIVIKLVNRKGNGRL